MLNCQKELFQLPDDIHYLNCAYMAPLPKATEVAGIKGMMRKRNPSQIKPADFFNETEKLKSLFATLVNAKHGQVACIPSASYGLITAMNNVPVGKGNHVIGVGDEFPSGYYAAKRFCDENAKQHKIIPVPDTKQGRGKKWNEAILSAINNDTTAVLISSVHWTDGTLFDLEKIGQRCFETGSMLIVDGTQSTGALKMDVSKYKIDALICAGYKWLLGPYSSGLALFSEKFNNGKPLEETWMNRSNALDFAGLTDYTTEYKYGAARYDGGEQSNFIHTPMLIASISQLLEWKIENIQLYCASLLEPFTEMIKEKGYFIEEKEHRASHILGIRVPSHISIPALVESLSRHKIFVSQRKDVIRVSLHLYNDHRDLEALQEVLNAV